MDRKGNPPRQECRDQRMCSYKRKGKTSRHPETPREFLGPNDPRILKGKAKASIGGAQVLPDICSKAGRRAT